MKNTQIFLTPNEGKQLIADALASLDFVQEAMREHTVVVVMGTTNAYLANALLSQLGEEEIDMKGFHRGITKPGSVAMKVPAQQYDLVIEKGKVVPEKTIFDVAGTLTKDDVIFKGANAVHISSETAGVLIGPRPEAQLWPASRLLSESAPHSSCRWAWRSAWSCPSAISPPL